MLLLLPRAPGLASDSHPSRLKPRCSAWFWGLRAVLSLTLTCSLACSFGCAHTPIQRTSIAPEVFELAARSSRSLQVSVTHTISGSQGHQYLLVILPLGRVTVEDPSGEVFSALYPMLATRGIRPVHPGDCTGCALLSLTVGDISLSAFDFLVTRRVRARVRIDAVLHSASGALLWQSSVDESAASLRTYGFAPQLRGALDKALQRALEPIARASAEHY